MSRSFGTSYSTTYEYPYGTDGIDKSTLLARFITSSIFDSDKCTFHDRMWNDYGYNDDYDNCYCYSAGNKQQIPTPDECHYCKIDKRIIFSHIIVYVPEISVRSKPSDAVYAIRAVLNRQTTQSKLSDDLMNISEFDMEFTIADTIEDSTTVPDDKADLVKRCYSAMNVVNMEMFASFTGLAQKSFYCMYFLQLIDKIITNSRTEIVTNSNSTCGGIRRVSCNNRNTNKNSKKSNPHIAVKRK